MAKEKFLHVMRIMAVFFVLYSIGSDNAGAEEQKESATALIKAFRAVGEFNEKWEPVFSSMNFFSLVTRTALLEALKSDDPRILGEAIVYLPQAGLAAENIEVLRKALNNENHALLRRKAALALAAVGVQAKPLLTDLTRALKDAHKGVIEAASYALAQIGTDERSIDLLIPLLKEHSGEIAINAAGALGTIGPAAKDAAPALKSMLDDVNEFHRVASARALGKIGVEIDAAVTALNKLLASSDAAVRQYAAENLGDIGVQARSATDGLRNVLRKDKNSAVRLAVVNALKTIGPDANRAGPGLAEVLLKQDEIIEIRVAATEALVKVDPQSDRSVTALS